MWNTGNSRALILLISFLCLCPRVRAHKALGTNINIHSDTARFSTFDQKYPRLESTLRSELETVGPATKLII